MDDIIYCKKKMVKRLLPLFLLFTFQISWVYGQHISLEDTVSLKGDELLNLSLEDLMNIRVITPTQSLLKSNSAPATVLVVTGDQIKLRGYRNLAEILNDLPDFKIDDKSDPQFYNAISVRGQFRQDRFVILLDGVRISSPTNEPLPLLENFPIYLAKQIEVVYGPGSALYGADAMAGVINIITEKGTEEGNLSVTSMVGTQGYSNNTLSFNKGLKNDFNLTLGGQYAYDAQPDFSKVYKDEYDMTSQRTGLFNTAYGPATPSQPIDPNYEAPIKAYNFYSSLSKDGFNVKILHHYSEVPSSTTLKPHNAVYNKNVFYGQGVTTGSASYAATIGNLKSTTNVVGSFYRVNPQSNFRNMNGGVEHGYKYSTGSMIKIEEQLNISVLDKVNLAGGLTYELFQSLPKTPELQVPVNEKGATEGILLNSASDVHPEGIEAKFFPLVYTNIGSYLQALYDPSDIVSFTLGARYDHNSRFGSTINPRIGAVLTPTKKTTIKVLYGTAYWAPSPLVSFESYGSFYTMDGGQTYQSAYWHLPNPDLKPMTSQTAEISVNQKVGRNFSATVTGYYTHIKDIIKNVPDNGYTNLYNNRFSGWDVGYIEVPYNLGNQTTYGGNLMINSTFNIGKSRFNAYSSLSYVEGTVLEFVSWSDTKEVELSMIAPWQYRVGLDGKFGNLHFSARLLQLSEQRVGGFATAENPYKRQTIDGYTLLNGSIGYTVKNRVTFFTNFQNALDKRYRNPLPIDITDGNAPTFSGALQDPLRVMAGLRVAVF